MIKNTAGQFVAFQLLDATDGSNVTTGSPTVYLTKDGGTQVTGSGAVAHEGNGQWSYACAQADTDADHVAFTIVLADSISQTVNLYPKVSPPTATQISEQIATDIEADLDKLDTILANQADIVVAPIYRDVTDELPIYFSWHAQTPTPTVTVSIDGGAFASVSGAVSRFSAYDLAADYVFQLAYNASDRPTDAGTAVYRVTDGIVTNDVVVVLYKNVGDIVSILGTSITEATAGNLAGNLSVFFDNADAATTKTVDDVGGGAGGGDATEAKQDQILSALTAANVIQVASPNIRGDLVLVQGDTYDGVGNPLAQWNVTTDYTSGWSVTLTIRDSDDVVVYTTSGVVASVTLITVDVDTPTGLVFDGCPGVWQGKYDVQLSKSGSVQTIAVGKVYIQEDQTR